uniref:Uncharacterized protein n=1 Tax=Parascaris equorum TaxID=6256 RepID=A0A914R7U3_PAREQ
MDKKGEQMQRNGHSEGTDENAKLLILILIIDLLTGVKLDAFFNVCEDGSRMVMLLLFSIICALLSGCCLSSTIVFTGRIKHVLLTHAPKTEGFRMRTFEQVYILASLTAFAIVANFCTVS